MLLLDKLKMSVNLVMKKAYILLMLKCRKQKAFLLKHIYIARANDYAMTGRWVYQQIIDGNIVGSITQLAAGVDPVTGLPPVAANNQPQITGSQDL
jgi:hypothetical protein